MSLFRRTFIYKVSDKTYGPAFDVVAITEWSNGTITKRVVGSYDDEAVAYDKCTHLNETLGGERGTRR